jgi:quinol monooxygenase YgiN
MAHPIVFISHFTIKPGKVDDLKLLARDVATRLEAEKPQTLIYLTYLDDNRTHATFVHLFADAATMDLHFEGARERSEEAFELMTPIGWEVYGEPSAEALGTMQRAATSAGVPLTFHPEYLAGFVRLSG